MKLKEFLQTLLNVEEKAIKVNGHELSYNEHIQDLSHCPNADSDIIMWKAHHDTIDIWAVEPQEKEE